MKYSVLLICLLAVACQEKRERFNKKAVDFSEEYVGHWEAILPGGGPKIFQATVNIEPSGDSLVWGYFSQIVDTTTNRKIPCGPEVYQMPIWWDDSLQLAQGNHGVGQGYGWDSLRLKGKDTLQINSFSLASNCRGPFGFNDSQLLLVRVKAFRYKL